MIRIARIVFVVLCLVELFGCAHVTAIEKACKPAATDVDVALTDMQADGWKAALEAFALAKGVCIAKAAVQQVIDALSPRPGTSVSALEAGNGDTPSSAELVARGKQFLAAHP